MKQIKKKINFSPFLKHFSKLEEVSFAVGDRFEQRDDFFTERVRSTGARITKITRAKSAQNFGS